MSVTFLVRLLLRLFRYHQNFLAAFFTTPPGRGQSEGRDQAQRGPPSQVQGQGGSLGDGPKRGIDGVPGSGPVRVGITDSLDLGKFDLKVHRVHIAKGRGESSGDLKSEKGKYVPCLLPVPTCFRASHSTLHRFSHAPASRNCSQHDSGLLTSTPHVYPKQW